MIPSNSLSRLLRFLVPASLLFAALYLLLQTQVGLDATSFVGLGRSRNAYVFYAVQDEYACSVAVNVFKLRTELNTKHRIIVLMSHDVSPEFETVLQSLGAEVIYEEPMPLHEETIPYYAGCLLKLAAFRMHEIDPSISKVLTLDSDQLVLKNLDHLFDLPLQDFKAAHAYWLSEDTLSSTLMLIKPNPKQWLRVQETMSDPHPAQYDMDMVASLFGKQPDNKISGKYATVNSHWEDWNIPPWFESTNHAPGSTTEAVPATDDDLNLLRDQAQVVHFFAIGKPWYMTTAEVRDQKPSGHEVLFEQWAEWRRTAANVCPAGMITEI